MKEKIFTIIQKSIEEINIDLEEKIEFDKDINLMSTNNSLDSFSFVNLILIIENNISEEFNTQITLVNDNAFSRKKSPFQNIQTLCNYIIELLEK